MNQALHNDLQNLEQLLQNTLSQGVDYLQQLNELPTSVNQSITDQLPLPLTGSGGTSTLAEFTSRYEKLMVASAGPRYWGFVTGGTTPAAIMGDILATIYDQNTQTAKGHGDLSGAIELETINMLLELFELPSNTFLGGFVTGATMSNFTCLGVARQWIGKELGFDAAKEGIQQPIKVLAAVPHSSSIKAIAMLGLGSSNISFVNTIDPSRESMDVAALESQIEQLNGAPFILISSGGTVNTVDYDDMQAIAQLKKKHNFWWHIDAAFGGFAVLSEQHKHLLKGWELADSITIDGHKWLNVPYESAFFFTRKEHAKLQIETFQNSNAPYLGDPLENFNFLNFLPENSRRFKALATWFTLKAYGKSGYEEIVTRNIAQAQRLGNFIDSTDEFRLLAPTRLNTVCFTLNETLSDKLDTFLDVLNGRGKVFMTPTVFNKTKGIRAALVNWRTTDEDVELVEKELLEVINLI
ncbi:pyridoxal phosphate-dependent decarboxylase family protein [Marinoscillum pacificum]|uniref:pyridoxal phosphate-dependent decarboxylase family protein n=1 Tax=Marinoscillum pacificum TaxID=392723 RepID=UPI002157ED78|nr:pyridoxal-dependent decarboxylase [Marinoscillum pacificum]